MMSAEKTLDSIVRVDNLTLAYGNNVVLDRVSFEVKTGSCLFVMGGVVVEKLLLKSMVGLLEPVKGEISVNGSKLWDDQSNMNQVLKNLGFVSRGSFVGSMTIQKMWHYRPILILRHMRLGILLDIN